MAIDDSPSRSRLDQRKRYSSVTLGRTCGQDRPASPWPRPTGVALAAAKLPTDLRPPVPASGGSEVTNGSPAERA